MKTKHTPGPWKYVDGDDQSCEVNAGPTTIAIDRCDKNTFGFVISREEMEANAKLIASAPKLLEELIKAKNALSVFLERHSRIINKDWQDAFKAGIEAMDLAIKKATG